jgi:hypothetical protein
MNGVCVKNVDSWVTSEMNELAHFRVDGAL